MKQYYALKNFYSSETDTGFANTWYAVSFSSRRARDAYVARALDRATRACTRAEAKLTGHVVACRDDGSVR